MDDAFKYLGRTRVIPHVVWLNDNDRTHHTETETVRLGAEDLARLIEFKLLEARLEIVPGFEPLFHAAALWLRLISTDHHMTLVRTNAERCCLFAELYVRFHFRLYLI